MNRGRPQTTLTDTLFPCPSLFRSSKARSRTLTRRCAPPSPAGGRGLSSAEPGHRAFPGAPAAGEAGSEQVAAGRRLPVEHLAGEERAGRDRVRTGHQHQRIVERLEPEAAGAADRLRSEEHTSELQSLKRNTSAVFWLKQNKIQFNIRRNNSKHEKEAP